MAAWGVLRNLREEVEAKARMLIIAIVLDAIAPVAFLMGKRASNPRIVGVRLGDVAVIVGLERFFLERSRGQGAGRLIPSSPYRALRPRVQGKSSPGCDGCEEDCA